MVSKWTVLLNVMIVLKSMIINVVCARRMKEIRVFGIS